MMGRQTGDQSQLFYLFNLERRIPAGHLLRRIDPVVTRILTGLRDGLAPFYSDIGRPSIDPELLLREPSLQRKTLYLMSDKLSQGNRRDAWVVSGMLDETAEVGDHLFAAFYDRQEKKHTYVSTYCDRSAYVLATRLFFRNRFGFEYLAVAGESRAFILFVEMTILLRDIRFHPRSY
jgi:hypothetical protein